MPNGWLGTGGPTASTATRLGKSWGKAGEKVSGTFFLPCGGHLRGIMGLSRGRDSTRVIPRNPLAHLKTLTPSRASYGPGGRFVLGAERSGGLRPVSVKGTGNRLKETAVFQVLGSSV